MTTLNKDQLLKLKQEHNGLYQKIHSIFLKYDPLEIHFDEDKDEYGPELLSLLPKLKKCKSESDALVVTREVFIDWFGESSAKDLKSKFEPIAREIWQACLRQAGT